MPAKNTRNSFPVICLPIRAADGTILQIKALLWEILILLLVSVNDNKNIRENVINISKNWTRRT